MGTRQIRGNRYHSGVETSKEGSDEVKARRKKEQCLPSGDPLVLQHGSDDPRPCLELRVRQALSLDLTIGQKGVYRRVRAFLSPLPEEIYQGLKMRVMHELASLYPYV